MAREYTNLIIEKLDDRILDPGLVIIDLLNWLSESEVKEFFEQYLSGDDEDEEGYEDDGQPTEAEEWRDYDPDC
jgi:hypothetical protein